ncbi:MAG: flagellar basal body L-ring protein FlgH [Sphingobacteriia bacterium]|nr:flagellar basal body L-ring protein FlgH [Sphingobacteriia bacterium]NCC38997.1 flagellar basal body L-ring protein FlgH [Gammaproteobacteria bacterium]
MTVRPQLREPQPANGAIFQASSVRPLFEDRRARHPGDIITINLVERNVAQKSTNAQTSRRSNLSAGVDAASASGIFPPFQLDAEAGSSSTFSGSGAAAANNLFSGTITVTVIDVYPNGNLLVSGEKMLIINQGHEYIRFSGVINPHHITYANSVQSTQVADARIEYVGSGFIKQSTRMAWLQRFFNTIMPL